MLKKTLLALLLLAGGVFAEVTAPVNIGYSTNGHPLLGIPRFRGGRQGDTLVMMTAQGGSNQTGWTVSYNRGTTWSDVRARWMTTGAGVATWYSSDHSAAWFAGGLHIVSRGYAGTDPAFYRYVAAPYASETNLETVDVPTGVDTYYPVVVATSANDVWLFDMNEGSSRNNLRYWHTTNRFATAATVGRVCTISDDPQNYWRMGAIVDGNGYPKVCIYDFDRGFSIWTYDPDTESFDSSLVVANSMGAGGRSYAFVEMNGRDHLVYGHGPIGPLVHFYETSEGVFDSTLVSDMDWDRLAPQLCVYGEGPTARLYCAYVDQSMRACLKSWTLADGWDADSVVVSGSGHNVEDPAMVPYIPSSWGFVPIWYHNDDDNNLYFVQADAASTTPGDTIAPDEVHDLGMDDATETTITLSWTAPGDDVSSGTATSYDMRRSTSPINTTNWTSATSLTGEPTPQTAGTHQSMVVTGLSEGTTYYFALKACDDEGNWSGLSNVEQASTDADVTPPAAINDLGAVTGSEDGTIDLAWTSPGDDGDVGTTASYSIRFSVDSITEANWSLATTFAAPTPRAAGASESLTLTGLTPAQEYYVGVKARDDALNESPLSNVARAEAYLDIGLDVPNDGSLIPLAFALAQNYPNPFNPSTVIEYSLPTRAHITLTIHNVQGQEITRLVDAEQPAGIHRIVFDASLAPSHPLASGVYFCRLHADDRIATTKMVLLR